MCFQEMENVVTKNHEAVGVEELDEPPSCITRHPGFPGWIPCCLPEQLHYMITAALSSHLLSTASIPEVFCSYYIMCQSCWSEVLKSAG